MHRVFTLLYSRVCFICEYLRVLKYYFWVKVWLLEFKATYFSFQPKGADRKQKTDREKMEKRTPHEKEKYQPSYETTILTEVKGFFSS